MNDSKEVPIPVLIVGAGPTGLAAALELSRLGVAVRIVDRAAAASPESRALAVQARTLELLRVRGVGQEMLPLGNRADTAALYAGGRRLAPIELHRMPSDFNYILMLAQSETERLLAEGMARQGVKVERGVEVVAVRELGNCAEARLRRSDGAEEMVRASYVIAADGPHSTVRKGLNLPFPGRTLPHHYVLADLHVDGDIPEDQVSIFLASHGFIALFPMGDGRFRLMATDPERVPGAGEPTVEHIQRLYDRVAHIPARLYSPNWSSRFRINSRHMKSLQSGRVFFGGDAAHVHSPAGGQGMNLGIQDMVNLSWKLAMVLHGRARRELLDTYSSERLPVIRKLVRFTEIGTRVFNSTNPLVHAIRIRMAPKALSRNRIQNAAASMFGQLSADYRGGVFGDGVRVPDADGLYDALDLNALTLFSDDDAALKVARRWDGAVSSRAGRGVGWLLVRPDGYLAAAGDPGDVAALERLLERWFIPSS